MSVEPPRECFLEGCQVIYQLDDQSQQRLERLEAGKQYHYPAEFALPPHLPVSLDHKLLNGVHISIEYHL